MKTVELKKVRLLNIFEYLWFEEAYFEQIKTLFYIIKTELEERMKSRY